MTAHTPGPWHIVSARDEAAGVDVVNDSGWVSINDASGCLGSMYMHSEEQNTVNARLAAAAPKLYEACASVWAALADTDDMRLRELAHECRAAIAETEPRS